MLGCGMHRGTKLASSSSKEIENKQEKTTNKHEMKTVRYKAGHKIDHLAAFPKAYFILADGDRLMTMSPFVSLR